MSDQVWSAIIGSVSGIIGGLLAVWIQYGRLKREFALQDKAQAGAKALLNSERWKKRDFQAIKERLGGFDDNELRKILVAVGAVRFKAQDGHELWGLASRNQDDL